MAEATTTTDQEVSSIGTMLAVLSVVGVLSATLLGWAVARAGLAPVARLAGVAEEVTLTGDPGRRVEVRRRDELGRLAMSFNAMLGALQRSLDAQRRLVSDASHELRTPLASLRINADVLLEHPEMPAAERNEVLARVADQVEELSRLVVSVTDLARGEPLQRERSQIRFDAVTSDALDAARRDWPKTEFDADLAPCTVNGSADRLRVAVKNLLDNAAKFGPPEGPIEVRLADGELTVRDHGPGIDPDDLPFIFDRFYRATSSRSAPGAGLGLAVVREIALGHGGMVTADPAPGGGTVMRFRLPGRRRPDPAAEDTRPDRPARRHGGEPGASAPARAPPGAGGSPAGSRSLRAARSAWLTVVFTGAATPRAAARAAIAPLRCAISVGRPFIRSCSMDARWSPDADGSNCACISRSAAAVSTVTPSARATAATSSRTDPASASNPS